MVTDFFGLDSFFALGGTRFMLGLIIARCCAKTRMDERFPCLRVKRSLMPSIQMSEDRDQTTGTASRLRETDLATRRFGWRREERQEFLIDVAQSGVVLQQCSIDLGQTLQDRCIRSNFLP